MTFELALRRHLEAKPVISRTRDENRVLEILDWPESNRKERVIKRMERHVRVELDAGDDEINWGEGTINRRDGHTVQEIDWLRVIQFVAYILWILIMIFAPPPPVGAARGPGDDVDNDTLLDVLKGSFYRDA